MATTTCAARPLSGGGPGQQRGERRGPTAGQDRAAAQRVDGNRRRPGISCVTNGLEGTWQTHVDLPSFAPCGR